MDIRSLKKLTSRLIHDALAEIRSQRPNSSIADEKRLRTAEYFLLEARDYVDGAWEMLAVGNARAAIAISRWTLEAAMNLCWAVSDENETEQRLADLAAEALRQDANLLEGLRELWPNQAHAFMEGADKARQVRGELGPVKLDSLKARMKDVKLPDRPDWPPFYVLYRICCAAAHPDLKVWERFKTVGQATVSTEPSHNTIMTSDTAAWMAAASALYLVSFACCLAKTGNVQALKEWWAAGVVPLLG